MEKTFKDSRGVTYCRACGGPDCPIACPSDPFWARCPAADRAPARPALPVDVNVETIGGGPSTAVRLSRMIRVF